MNPFDLAYEKIEKNKKNWDEGDFNCIPFISMKRLEKFIPGIERSSAVLITAATGVKRKV